MERNLDRRQFILTAGAAAGSLLADPSSLAADSPSTDDLPNIIFILIDDLGWRDVGYRGTELYETPNVDRLARSGMRFSDAYAACPVCSPTRSSIMTGTYPARLNLTDWIPGLDTDSDYKLKQVEDLNYLPLDEVTIAEALKAAGYTTCHIGKWHLGGKGHMPGDQGFDINICGDENGSPPGYFAPFDREGPGWDELNEDARKGDYLTDLLSRRATDFIRKNRNDPFFLYLSHFDVHVPRQAKEKYREFYREKLEQSGKPSGPSHRDEKYDAVTKLHQDNAIYAGMVQSMDESVGRVLDTLEETGLRDDTIVVFMSDNGGLSTVARRGDASTSVTPLRAGKGWCYEGGIREPCIISYPGVVERMTICSEPVISTDFYPTILDLAGLPLRPEQHVDGLSMVPLLQGADELDRDALYWHYPHYAPQQSRPHGAVRMGRWKLLEFYEDMSVELYDLQEDIGEQNDLSEKMPEKTAELRERFHRWRERVDAPMPQPNPEYQPG